MTVSETQIERGMKALHEASTYRGYNQETLDREWVRMELIYRAHVTAILTAALSDQAETIRACAKSTLIGFQTELGDRNIEFICDQIARKVAMGELPDQAGGWQDISTAKKDGRRIEYHNGRTIDPIIGYCRWATWPEDDLEDWWDYERDCEAYPKFWRPEMPLPTAKPQPAATPTSSDDLCKALTGIAAFNLSDNPEAQLRVYNAVRILRLLDRAGIEAGIIPAPPPSSTAGEVG